MQWERRGSPGFGGFSGPDFEEVARRVRSGLAGGGRRLGGILLLLAAAILAWSSWFTVGPEETAVVQRFGKVVRTEGPGLHFKFPYGVETARLVKTARVLKEEFGFRTQTPGRRTQYSPQQFLDESLMLTGDLNVLDVQWIVQYRIQDPVAFLFRLREPEETLRDTSEAVMRRVVGNRVGSDVLTVGRVAVAAEVKEELQTILNTYGAGVHIVAVELQDVTPPDPVKPAFNEVNEARQDRERKINQAQEVQNREIPKARGEAGKTVSEAEGYGIERVNQAKGEADRFLAILGEYRQAKEVTRRRLYLEAIGEILPNAKNVYIVDEAQQALVPWLSLGPGVPAAAAPAKGGGKP